MISVDSRKFGLDVARAAAIIMVLAAHSVKAFKPAGFYGVELFFALSGFLIGGIIYRNLLTPGAFSFSRVKNFWLRRWWRTLPNYYLFFFLWILDAGLNESGRLPAFADLVAHMAFLQNMHCGLHRFYGVSWSLCVEEWFYLLFPLTILLLVKIGLGKRNSFLVATALFLLIPALSRELLFHTCTCEQVRQTTFARLDAIFYGVAASFIIKRYSISSRMKIIASAIGFTAIIAVLAAQCLFGNSYEFYFFRIAFVLVPASFALTLPWLETISERIIPIEALAKSITNLSLWSYSIYLCHVPILWIVYLAFGASRTNPTVNVLSHVIGLLLVFGFSRWIFLHFEAPLTRLRPPELAELRERLFISGSGTT